MFLSAWRRSNSLLTEVLCRGAVCSWRIILSFAANSVLCGESADCGVCTYKARGNVLRIALHITL